MEKTGEKMVNKIENFNIFKPTVSHWMQNVGTS